MKTFLVIDSGAGFVATEIPSSRKSRFAKGARAAIYRGDEPPTQEQMAQAVAARLAGESSSVPQSVTPWQLRKALNAAGLRSVVENAVANADQTTRDAWEYASEFLRSDLMLNALAAAMGMGETQVDDLFRLAATL